ncbi:MAG: 1-(5-phosphoribosyl)-5-[(5-phosphoribosylamino)methylideneamino]imidazole-4-carboxamide isomerase [SAR202 cluster bacterium]|nr:1-(5-phosphoribosyl)-5-[(5-phosphoribosylamino)methylideneamino]imidazole-4-carboxamide isomerase [SAR202 cluster bacterium]
MSFEVVPALDLRGGKCVRLYQGDFSRETVFSDNPLEMAQHWVGLGAARLHVVDLDGAAHGEPANLSIIRRIVAAVSCPVQVGGGIRDIGAVRRLLDYGVVRVIVGTAAVKEPALVEELCRSFAEAIVVGIDAQEGIVAVKGWRELTGVKAVDLGLRMVELGVPRLIYTDISRDGTLSEPNFAALEQLLAAVPVPVIAAGGIVTVEHLQRLAAMGCEGAIVGRALYAGNLDLPGAIRALRGTRAGP